MTKHIPVLQSAVLTMLQPKPGDIFLDVTAGYGGHSQTIIDAIGPTGEAFLQDKDAIALDFLAKKFAGQTNVHIKAADFSDLSESSYEVRFSAILADLGVSSPQIDEPERGFSFQKPGPLDMRMDSSQELSAKDIVNTYSQTELADLFYLYGEERRSRQLAKNIVHFRQSQVIATTDQLADIIAANSPGYSKIHPATRVFQALRIAVNDELGALEHLLEVAPKLLQPGGRLSIISFHSLEDRMVKQRFKALSQAVKDDMGNVTESAQFRVVTKKPVMAQESDKSNPRARSAKLRTLENIN